MNSGAAALRRPAAADEEEVEEDDSEASSCAMEIWADGGRGVSSRLGMPWLPVEGKRARSPTQIQKGGLTSETKKEKGCCCLIFFSLGFKEGDL